MATTLTTIGRTLKIERTSKPTVFINSMNGDFKIIDNIFILEDSVSDKEYNLGAYTNVTGFTTENELIEHLAGFFANVDTNLQDQTTPDISFYLAQVLDTITIRENTTINTSIVKVTTTGTVPVVGNFICMKEGISFLQAEVTVVTPIAGNDYDLTISIPLDFAFTVLGGCSLQNVNMNVNGSVTPVVFTVSPSGLQAGEKWDITRMMISMTMSSAGDDGLFGNIAKLTNGVYFRTVDGTTNNLFNVKENANFAEEGFDVTYAARSGGGGTFGMRSRITFAGQDKRGVVKRLVADTNDEFQGVTRDNLTTITSFRVKLQGHVVNK